MSVKAYLKDVAEMAAGEFKSGRLSRRDFMTICAAAGVSPLLLRGSPASAAANEVVMWNWGGDAVACHSDVFGKPFTEETGVGFAIDSSGPSEGSIKAMVESGNVTADVCDGDLFQAESLGSQGFLEPIDYSVVKKELFRNPDDAKEFGVAMVYYGYCLMYDSEKFGANPPTGWADFWDLEKFPGKRTLYKWGNGVFEAAMQADGVPMDQVYPIDMDRVLKKVREIKSETVFWGSGAEPQQLFQNAEVAMGMIYSNRALLAERDTKGRFKLIWNGGLSQAGGYIVPKGNPAGRENVMKFLASCQVPEKQVNLFKCLGQAPSNPAAVDMVPPELKRYNSTDPENYALQVHADNHWYAQNYEAALEAYLNEIAS